MHRTSVLKESAPPQLAHERHRPEKTLLYRIIARTTRSFVLTWRNKDSRYHTTYKRNSMNTSNVADWSMAFYAYNAVLAIMNNWLRSAVPTVGALGERRGFCPSCGARRMAESAALLVDEVLPHEPMRQLLPWMACSRAMQEQLPRVLSFPFQLRFLFASRPELMGKVLGIVYRAIASHLIKKAGLTQKTAQTGAVTLIQRFGSALNLNPNAARSISICCSWMAYTQKTNRA